MNSIFLLTRPNHDVVMNYLYHWSEEIIEHAENNGTRKKIFSGKEVSRKNIEDFITSQKPRLMIFNAHGNDSVIGGQNNEPIIDAASNLNMLRNSIIYALACSCSVALGPKAVENGAESFIGYTKKFAIMIDPNREATPIKDKRAEPFKRFSNSVCISLIDGKTAKDSCNKALELGDKLIREYSTSDSQEVNEAIRFFLFRNMEVLKLDGNPNASFI